jgi:hypothetical protein
LGGCTEHGQTYLHCPILPDALRFKLFIFSPAFRHCRDIALVSDFVVSVL